MSTSPEPGKPLSETELKPCPFCNGKVSLSDSPCCINHHCNYKVDGEFVSAFAMTMHLEQFNNAQCWKTIEHQAAQIRAYGKALEKIASYEQWSCDCVGECSCAYRTMNFMAGEVLEQYPLSVSENKGSGEEK